MAQTASPRLRTRIARSSPRRRPARARSSNCFTSQGCSSCPPGRQLLVELARDPDVIALTLPVDYWDYLGWKDTLAHSAFTARQRDYASASGDRQVYTPQAVVNGVKASVGSDRAELARAIALAGLPVPVTTRETGARLAIEVGAASVVAQKGEVWVLPVIRAREVAIGKGENRGHSITYANVVRGLFRVGAWSGAAARFEVPLEQTRAGGSDGYVVLLQASEPGRPAAILGGAKGPGL
jgi:hypothetical protein